LSLGCGQYWVRCTLRTPVRVRPGMWRRNLWGPKRTRGYLLEQPRRVRVARQTLRRRLCLRRGHVHAELYAESNNSPCMHLRLGVRSGAALCCAHSWIGFSRPVRGNLPEPVRSLVPRTAYVPRCGCCRRYLRLDWRVSSPSIRPLIWRT
jgi:hypothetical protein